MQRDIGAHLRSSVAQFLLSLSLPPETRLGVAVSGGADSVCLLHLLREFFIHLSIVHLNHRLRGEASDADAQFVAALADSLSLPLHLRAIDIPAVAVNVEDAAREARYSFFRELIKSGAVDRVATGHNRNDQAETVLYRIVRGSGLTGLSGILPVTSDGVIRPLLNVERTEIEAWLKENQIDWRQDETNQNRALARNRIRHEVLPMLRSEFNPQITEALSCLAELARDEEEYWQVQAQSPPLRDGTVIFEINELTEVPVALARRRVRSAISRVKGDLRLIESSHVQRILQMAHKQEGTDRVQLPGLDVSRSFEWIRLALAGHDQLREAYFSLPVSVPGTVVLPDGCRISLEVQENKADCVKLEKDLDWPKFLVFSELEGGQCEVRNWRPGDSYRPVGHHGDQKLKLLFQDYRIPLWERPNWPILVCNNRIVWTRRFGPAADLAASPGCGRNLRIYDGAAAADESTGSKFTSQ